MIYYVINKTNLGDSKQFRRAREAGSYLLGRRSSNYILLETEGPVTQVMDLELRSTWEKLEVHPNFLQGMK